MVSGHSGFLPLPVPGIAALYAVLHAHPCRCRFYFSNQGNNNCEEVAHIDFIGGVYAEELQGQGKIVLASVVAGCDDDGGKLPYGFFGT